MENQKAGFPLFPPPLEIRKSSGFPHFHSYYGGGGGGLEASPNPQRPKVGQIKPPKWAKRTCQTHLALNKKTASSSPGNPGPEERNPCQCQVTTVSGWTIRNALRQSFQILENQTQDERFALRRAGPAPTSWIQKALGRPSGRHAPSERSLESALRKRLLAPLFSRLKTIQDQL